MKHYSLLLVKIFIWTKLKTLQRLHAIARTEDNTDVIPSRSNQSKKIAFSSWPDFVNKRSGCEIDNIISVMLKEQRPN